MLRALIVLAGLAALTACGPPAADKAVPPPTATEGELNAFDVHIEVGRYGAMLSTVDDLTMEMESAVPDDDVSEPREMTRQLREHVWEYNLLRSKMCARGLYTQVSCGAAYNPVWLADPADAEVSLAEIQQRNEALGSEVMALWGAVCDDHRSRVAEEEKMAVCPME